MKPLQLCPFCGVPLVEHEDATTQFSEPFHGMLSKLVICPHATTIEGVESDD